MVLVPTRREFEPTVLTGVLIEVLMERYYERYSVFERSDWVFSKRKREEHYAIVAS